MLEDDLTSEVKLHDGVNIPTGTGAGHRIIGTESSPTQVETLFVSIDVLEREVRVLGIEQRQSQFTIAATLVDEVLSRFEGAFVLGYFGFGHVHHPEDFPHARLQSPACVVWPEDRPVALVLLALEKVRWIAHDTIVGVEE
jgi:hypothetical protein